MKRFHHANVGAAVLALVLGACQQSATPPAAPGQTAAAPAGVIHGAGASFPYPVYAQWASDYHRETGARINFQSIGSGGGIAQIKARTVDFGATDAPLTQAELDGAGLAQWPMVIGGIVLAVNLEGVVDGQLRLTPEALAGIFLGRVTRWDDPAIARENPDLKLPGAAITVVHRADGSGTTWILTNYLDKVSPEWRQQVGAGKEVAWPAGVGGKGNEGVTAYVQRIKGAIGYLESAYATQNNLVTARLRNRAGRFVAPSRESFQAAAASADWQNAPGFYQILTDQPGDESWPITGATFILLPREPADPARARAVLQFFDWCFQNGEAAAIKLHYVPMPRAVIDLVRASWKKDIQSKGQALWN